MREEFERFGDAGVGAGGIQFVLVVMGEEELQGPVAFMIAGVSAQSAADQLWRTVADVAGDGVFVKLLAAHFLKSGVDGANQVALGIDERAVEIEDQRANGREIWSSHEHTSVIWRGFFSG